MKRDPRGFEYTLAPLHLKCGWELQEAQQTLARLNDEFAEQTARVGNFDARLADAHTELAQQQGGARIYLDRQLLSRHYIAALTLQRAAAQAGLLELEAVLETATADYHRLQQFADGLARQREREVTDYRQLEAKADSAEADDSWLRSIHWRATQ